VPEASSSYIRILIIFLHTREDEFAEKFLLIKPREIPTPKFSLYSSLVEHETSVDFPAILRKRIFEDILNILLYLCAIIISTRFVSSQLIMLID